MPNRLVNEKSPYLLLHKNNPVNWYPWGDEAFETAKKRDIPIFLSIGYFSCHWCHVMEKEIFDDSDAAKILNDNFISIKVDREERPDIDHFYMEACQSLNGSGGWPLSVFLTPEKQPFFAGTYFPKYDGLQIGFLTLCERIIYAWKNKRNALYESSNMIMEYLKKPNKEVTDKLPDYDKAYKIFEINFDKDYGGFFSSPKFPSVFNLLYLIRYGKINPSSKAFLMVGKTLSAMAEGGLFDHIRGGFFRYSTDRKWLVPHFEKMLYDNALMLLVYSEAAAAIDNKYGFVARKVYEYLMRDMKNTKGGFYTSQDADSEGVEGKYYIFTPDEIISVLGKKEGEKFCEDYDITKKGNFEGKNIPNRIGKGMLTDDYRINSLLAYQNKRFPPLKDDKILTSSNALMAVALAVSGRLLNSSEMLLQAEKTAQFLLKNLYTDERLMAIYNGGQAAGNAVLDDYAYLLWAILELYNTNFNPDWLAMAIKVSQEIIILFSDISGGFYLSGCDIKDLPLRQKNHFDGAVPSGNGIVALNFLRLYEITGEEEYKTYADNILSESLYEIKLNPYSYSAHICAYMMEEYAVSIKIAAGSEVTNLLPALDGFNPFIVTSVYGKGYEDANKIINGKESTNISTVFVCDKSGCKSPIYTREDLEKIIDKYNYN